MLPNGQNLFCTSEWRKWINFLVLTLHSYQRLTPSGANIRGWANCSLRPVFSSIPKKIMIGFYFFYFFSLNNFELYLKSGKLKSWKFALSVLQQRLNWLVIRILNLNFEFHLIYLNKPKCTIHLVPFKPLPNSSKMNEKFMFFWCKTDMQQRNRFRIDINEYRFLILV